ncbi:MAG: hypothetical protein IPP32_16300 [Bacteroidetes bacterium]|nr:hypothetical protein [Bacteroidota bacterium]
MSANANLFYSSIFASYKPCYKKANESLLDIQLDTTILTKPSILLDPADSSRLIFVQDASNKIYLIDNKGKILWKNEMKEKIMSEVQSVNEKKKCNLSSPQKLKFMC